MSPIKNPRRSKRLRRQKIGRDVFLELQKGKSRKTRLKKNSQSIKLPKTQVKKQTQVKKTSQTKKSTPYKIRQRRIP